MTREDDYWTIVSGGRTEQRRRRLEHRDRIVSRVYTLLAVQLLLGGLAIICTPPLNQWVTDGRLTATAQAAQVSAATATDPAARILFLTTFADQSYIAQAMGLGAKGYLIKQDVAAVGPALQAVMAGQVVLGAEVLGKLTERTPDPADSDDSRDTADSIEGLLGEREREITALVAEGLDNRDIAARLFLSEGTVRNRISAILDKLGLTNRTQLAILWLNAHR